MVCKCNSYNLTLSSSWACCVSTAFPPYVAVTYCNNLSLLFVYDVLLVFTVNHSVDLIFSTIFAVNWCFFVFQLHTTV